MNVTDVLEAFDSGGFQVFRVMISILWQSSIVFGAVFGITLVLKRNRAAVRHAIWVAALLAVPVIPVLSLILTSAGTPQAPIPVIPQYTIPESTPESMNETIEMKAPYSQPDTVYDITPGRRTAPSGAHDPADNQSEAAPLNIGGKHFSVLSYQWACLLLVYITGVAFFLGVFVYGRFRISGWKTGSSVITDPDVLGIFHKAAGLLDLKKDFVIAENDGIEAPLTLRTFHPVILLPRGLIGSLSTSDLEAVALHELAHVKRHDVLTLTYVLLLRAALFFHPLVWMASRKVTNLAEQACDDIVLESQGEPISYAKMLTCIAERLPNRSIQTELAAGFLISKSAFLRRVEAILSERRDSIHKLSRLALTGTVAMVAVSLCLSFVFPLGEKSTTDTAEAHDSEEIVPTVISEPVTVSGKVLFDGQPVSQAEVYLDSAKEKVAETGKDGVFSFEMDKSCILGHEYYRSSIIVFKPDYAVTIVKFYENLDIENIEVNLEIGFGISGVVTDIDKYPIENARIDLMGYFSNFTSMEIWDSNIPGLCTATNKDGIFLLENLPQRATLMLNIIADGYAMKRIASIQPGSQNLRFFLEPEGIIQGKIVIGQSGESAKGIVVRAMGATSDMSLATITTTTDLHGRYTLKNLPAGIYNVYINENPDWTVTSISNVKINANGITKDVDLKLTKGGFVTGRITEKDSGNPVAYHELFLKDASRPDAPYYSHRIKTDSQGYYRFRSAPGNATVSTITPSGFIHESRAERKIKISAGKTVSDVNFEFVKGIEISGVVNDSMGIPVEGAVITAKLARRSRNGAKSISRSDKNGKFQISGFESGVEITIDAEHQDRKLRGEGTTVFKSGSKVDIQLESYHTADVYGRVLDPDGELISGARIILLIEMKDDGHSFGMTVSYTNAAGHYFVRDLIIEDEDRYSIRAEAEGYDVGSVPLPTLEPGMNELDHIILEPLERTRWLEGTVTDPAGNSIGGVRVIVNGEPSGLHQTITDKNGFFRFDKLVPEIEKQIAIDYKDNGWYNFHYLVTNRTHRFVLYKADGTISGRITDTDGKPIKDVGVRVYDHNVGPHGNVYYYVKTDARGNFTAKNLLDESYSISFYSPDKRYKKMENIPINTEDLHIVLSETDTYTASPEIAETMEYRKETKDRRNKLIGSTAPEIEAVEWLNTEPQKLADLHSNVVVLYFWNSDWFSTVKPSVVLNYWHNKYKGKGVVIIAIHEYTDDVDALKELLKDQKIVFPVCVDKQVSKSGVSGVTFDSYAIGRVEWIPRIYIIDRDGSVNFLERGLISGTHVQIDVVEEKIIELLGQKVGELP